MQRLIATLIILSLAGGGAVAQTGSTGQDTKTTRSKGPVGHRQPSKADIPAESKDNKDSRALSAEDKALDRRIKSICRGC